MMTINLYCRKCLRVKQNDFCTHCQEWTGTRELVHNMDLQFVRGWWHEADPFRYFIYHKGRTYKILAFGDSEDTGVFVELYPVGKLNCERLTLYIKE